MIRGRMARAAVIAVAAPWIWGCAAGAARVGQFEGFARAGVALGDAVPPVLDESFETTVATDSLVLVQARPDLPQAGRLAAITETATGLERRLAILDLKRHAGVLRSYFLALEAFAQATGDSTGLRDALVANERELLDGTQRLD